MKKNPNFKFYFRAKELLYVIGNKKLLIRDEIWASFIEYCAVNGLMIENNEPQSENDPTDKNYQKAQSASDSSELLK